MSFSDARVIHLEETGSTNQDAMRLAIIGETLPLWVTAGRQTHGRGRVGRSWTSGDGNLIASVAMICNAPMAQAGELALIAGIALIDAVRHLAPGAVTLPMRLKWPNDLLIGGAKAGGILVETTTARGQPGFLAVLGFGLNVHQHPDNLDRPVTSLVAHGLDVTAHDLARALTVTTETWLAAWDNGSGFAAFIQPAWQNRAGERGEAVSIVTDVGTIRGTYRGIDERGHLLVETDGGELKIITHGDVALANVVSGSGKE